MTRYRAALVGCGFFARNHLNAWHDLSDRAQIVAVCDSIQARADSAALEFGIPAAYDDVTRMLAEVQPDFVDIVTTAPSHRAIVEACAGAGAAVIVQKPLSPGWADACALVTAMERAGLPLMVHENFRFQRPLRRARALIDEGRIGEPVWGRFTFRTGYDIYAGQPYLAEVERFILLDVGIHMLDVARVLLGEAESVFCRSQTIRPGLRGEDVATVLLGHSGGRTSVVEMSYAAHPYPDPFPQVVFEIEGTMGALRLDPGCRLNLTTASETVHEIAEPAPPSWGSAPWIVTQESVLAIQQHWLDRLDSGLTPATSGRDNLKTFALVEAAYLSARTGQTVRPLAPPDHEGTAT